MGERFRSLDQTHADCGMLLKLSENFALSSDVVPNSIEYHKKGLH